MTFTWLCVKLFNTYHRRQADSCWRFFMERRAEDGYISTGADSAAADPVLYSADFFTGSAGAVRWRGSGCGGTICPDRQRIGGRHGQPGDAGCDRAGDGPYHGRHSAAGPGDRRQGRPDGRRRSGRADSPVFRAGRGVDRGHDPLCTAGGKAYECAGGRV